MRTYLTGITAFFAAFILSAFSPGPTKQASQEIILDWHLYNYNGDTELVPTVSFVGTEADARYMFDCPSLGPKICCRAYELNGIPTDYIISKL